MIEIPTFEGKRSGFRCYYGCYDSEGTRYFAYLDKLKRILDDLGGNVTYFPMEGKYVVFRKPHKPLSDYIEGKESALIWGIRFFSKEKESSDEHNNSS